MKTSQYLLAFVIGMFALGGHAASEGIQAAVRLISGTVYNDLVFYTSYCAASYGAVCSKPMGNVLVKRVCVSIQHSTTSRLSRRVQVRNDRTGTDGMVVRDDRRREIAVVFRGTSEFTDALTGCSNIDGVVTLPRKIFGYEHFATEYWNFLDPPSSLTTHQCRGREDPLCSSSVRECVSASFPFFHPGSDLLVASTGINLPHTVYFGQGMLAHAHLTRVRV
ncbi:hypothetical protein AN958_03496 [Leucoagaricus sp. SymC.cos]|nr:hypothetical protein AN958_03496 [Leucoagaricus sp. SymC.cos]